MHIYCRYRRLKISDFPEFLFLGQKKCLTKVRHFIFNIVKFYFKAPTLAFTSSSEPSKV